ncbi:MAG: ATP-grasp domain-containing protein [Planctomycetales bacterium]|nr:ATP-grasp domain-containing protein [Planctomycetales bacterium]
MSNVLVCSAGRRVSLVTAFKTELKRLLGNRNSVLACDLYPELSPACQIADQCFETGQFSDIEYVPKLLSACVERDAKLIVPTLDTELLLLSSNVGQFESAGTNLVISDYQLVQKCRDKSKTNELFLQYGFKVPKAIDPQLGQYPFFVKPISGSSSQDIYVIRSDEDLAPKLLDGSRFLHMEYLSPDEFDEYTIDLYYDRCSNLRCAVPRKRIAVRAGEIAKGITEKGALLEKIWSQLGYMGGARGCITLQVFVGRTDGEVYGIEINPRFGGGYPLSYQAGANFPAFLITEYLLDQPIPEFHDWEENLLFLRYDAEILIHAFDSR